MADKKISALTGAATPLAGTEVLPIVQSGATVKVSIANVTAGRAVSMLSGTITDSIATPVPLNINNNSASIAAGTRVNFQFNGSTVGFVGNQFDGGDFNNLYNASRGHIFTRGATQTMLIDNANDITVSAGNLKIGTAGKGIDFSASPHAAGMTSELLNDYEEGTFTPTWNGGTVTTNSAFYTKIGRMVTLIVDVTFGASASGASSVLTVPFTVGGTWGFGAVNFTDVSATISVNVDSGINGVAFRTAINTGNVSCVALSTKRVVFGATYFV